MRRFLALLAAVLLVPTAAIPAAAHGRDTYTNPVSAGFADTFADPVVVPGGDGFWYAYATSDPLRSGEGVPHRIPTARSADLVHWTYVGDAFAAAQLPSYAAPTAALWAPCPRPKNWAGKSWIDVRKSALRPTLAAARWSTWRLYCVRRSDRRKRDDSKAIAATMSSSADGYCGPSRERPEAVLVRTKQRLRNSGSFDDFGYVRPLDPVAVEDLQG